MSNPHYVSVRPIDHVVHAVADLGSAAEVYESMGFILTPRSDQPFGTSNRLIVLRRTYVELVAVTSPELVTGGFAVEVKRVAELGGGLAFLALKSHYAKADREALAMTGQATGDVFEFSRRAPRSDGTHDEAHFSLVFLPGFPGLGMFLCQHHTPESIWDPGFMEHPNGASELVGIRGWGQIDAEGIRRLEIVTGARVLAEPDRYCAELGGAAVTIERSEPAEAGPRLNGFTVAGSSPTIADISGATVEVKAS